MTPYSLLQEMPKNQIVPIQQLNLEWQSLVALWDFFFGSSPGTRPIFLNADENH